MKDNKYYFEYLLEQIKQGKYRKIALLKDNKGYQVKFGKGVIMNVNAEQGRATILLCDNSEIDIVPYIEAINTSQARKAATRLSKAKEAYDKAMLGNLDPAPKKTFLQRLFRK